MLFRSVSQSRYTVEKGIGRQTNIIGNHVALVVKGRAGSRCAIADKDGTITGTCDCGETDKNNDKEALAMVGKKSVILGQLKKWFDSRPFKDEDDLEKLLEEEEAITPTLVPIGGSFPLAANPKHF